jgi:iron complex transport system ATP-binding protein
VIDGVAHEVSAEAVVVSSRDPLTALSSALAGGGLATARAIVNLHVPKDWQPAARGARSGWEAAIDDFAARRGLGGPYVGLCTSARTEHAEVASEGDGTLGVLALASVGLGNPVAAGISRRAAAAAPSTINTIVVVEAEAPLAALVNLVMTVTEVKTAVLRDAGIRCAGGMAATGTSTDAVVVAATGRGRWCEFGGPISELGALAARATRRALERGVAGWLERHR